MAPTPTFNSSLQSVKDLLTPEIATTSLVSEKTKFADSPKPETQIVSHDLELSEESAVLKQIQKKVAEKYEVIRPVPPTAEEQKAIDAKSIFVGNVDFGATIEELEAHFNGCGGIVRTTIPKDKFTGRQKNFAYVQFEEVSSIGNALIMNGSIFRGRQIVVSAKRTNVPGMRAGGAPRGRGAYSGGPRHHQSNVIVKYVYINGPGPNRGPNGMGARGRRAPHYAPY